MASRRCSWAGRLASSTARRKLATSLVLLHAAGPVFLHFFGRGHFKGAHDAEADELRVREIKDALGQLGVGHFPRTIRSAPGGAAALDCFIVPGTAAHRVRVRLGRFVPWIGDHAARIALPIKIRVILVQDPFGYVAANVVKAPWIGLLLADFLILEIAVLFEPG